MRLTIFALIAQFLICARAWAASTVMVLTIQGPIGPAIQDYIAHGLEQAISHKASALILQLDTPGGLESSMREINNMILAAPIPVISYVAPVGARAMSAGTYIMYASHLAFMADGTTMGAATPIELGMPYPEMKNSISTKQQKMLQDAIAYIKSLALLRGRNVEWAVDAVLKSSAITAAEAKRLHVINGIANDYPSLLQQVHGQFVTVQGNVKTIELDHVTVKLMEPGWRYELLKWITDPNIAYLLLLLAIYAIVIELSHPGLILPGVTGIVSLIVALYAFQLMPLNYAGFSLLLMGTACLIAEIVVNSMGLLAILGLFSFVAGSLMLFDTSQTEYRVALSVIMSMAVVTGAFFLLLIAYVIKAQRQKSITGQEAMLSKEGVVIHNEQGKLIVKVMGDEWNARAAQEIKIGSRVKIIAIDGLVLVVEPIKQKNGE